jgi:hypothetical protein
MKSSLDVVTIRNKPHQNTAKWTSNWSLKGKRGDPERTLLAIIGLNEVNEMNKTTNITKKIPHTSRIFLTTQVVVSAKGFLAGG